jgi:Tol biopolymer transport system component
MIAYVGWDGTDYEIYTIDPTGGMPVQVTNNTTSDGRPSYSPDGKKIAYEHFDGTDWEIYTIGKTFWGAWAWWKPFQVTDNTTNDERPSYSPDGARIAYDGTANDIYTIDANGGTPFNVTNNHTNDNTPSWGSQEGRIKSR